MRNYLKLWRKDLQLTLAQLSDDSGVSIATISGLETEHYTPKLDTAYKLVSALSPHHPLGITITEIWPDNNGGVE